MLEVRQAELELPSDDPGDRLHAAAHAWAYESASRVEISVQGTRGKPVVVSASVAETGPLVAMKLQALMNRPFAKQGTDLLDILRLVLGTTSREEAVFQLSTVTRRVADDVAPHVEYWLVANSMASLRAVRAVGGTDVVADDLELVADLLLAACRAPRSG